MKNNNICFYYQSEKGEKPYPSQVFSHQFFTVSPISKPKYHPAQESTSSFNIPRSTDGVCVICANCGQMRKLWEDGIVEIINSNQDDRSNDSGNNS